MKYLTLLLIPLLFSCEKTKEDLTEIEKAYYEYESSVESLKNQKRILSESVSSLKNDEHYLKMIASGKKPLYILKLKVAQSSLSLDIGQHMKDGMNSSEFEIPVTKEYYDKLSVGDDLEDLWVWFTEEDVKELQKHGWHIHEYMVDNYKFYDKFQHYVICKETSTIIRKIEIKYEDPFKEDIPSYIEESQIMTIEDWIDYCECGAFIDFDGYGHFATEDKISDVEVYPSMVTKKNLKF